MRNDPVIMGSELNRKLRVSLLVLTSLLAFTRAQDLNPHLCLNSGNYTRNSTYRANLNTTLVTLSSNMTNNGFFNASVGQGQNRVNAIALCRGDYPLDRCRSCVENAAVELLQLCRNQKQAIRWYEFCMLHYSNQPIRGIETNGPTFMLLNPSNATSPEQFRQNRRVLLDVLRGQAANGSSLLKIGAGIMNTLDSDPLRGLLQCTPDLSPEECNSCLIQAAQRLPDAAGARALRPSCNIRYEFYPFYDETKLRQLQVSVTQIQNSPPGKDDGNTEAKKADNKAKIVIIVVVPIAVCLMLAACAVAVLRKRMKQRPQKNPEITVEISTAESLQYDFRIISAATDDFADANMLGQGGFGAVYRGKLSNGQEIAVKRLSRESGQGDLEFKNEVLLLARLQQKYLVRLLGFSMEEREKLLIYEFIPKGSLDHFIFDPIKGSYLDWGRRYKIIEGIAKGLLYLHVGSRFKIIHRDLKASNILLDGEMNPKIADFGVAKLFGQDETQESTSRVVGTYGYMSPEYVQYGQYSPKSDVFSYGVLVLEIMSGRKNFMATEENEEDLLSFAWKNWREETAENVIDPVLRAENGSMPDMLRCVHIALLCVQQNAVDRPTMDLIVLMLNSSTITLPVPLPPAFILSSHFGPGISLHYSKESNSSKASRFKGNTSEASSQNEMSISEFHPR